MTKAGVIQAIDRLEESGEIAVDRQDRPGSGSVNRYFMPLFSEWWAEARLIDIKGKKGKPYYEKGKPDEEERVNPISEKGIPRIPEPSLEPEIKEQEGNPPSLLDQGKDWNKIKAENERLEAAKAERRSRKNNRAAGNFQRPQSRPTAPPTKIVTNKQPQSWVWFSTAFKRLADANAFSHADLWPMVDEMLAEIGQEEAEQRLSVFIDGAERVTGYLAKDFLAGGWRTINLEDEAMPRIVNEE